MKKILFSLVVIILSFIAYNQAEAQCQYCIAPKLCHTFTLYVNGCGDVTYTVCYECGVAGRYVYRADFLKVTDVPVGCEDAVWDAGYEWVRNNVSQLCGSVACDQGIGKLIITRPICANQIYDASNPGKYTLEYDRTACDSRCVTEFEWCYCNCTPDCWEPPCPKKHMKSTVLNSYIEGVDNCVKQIVDLFSPISWIVHCQKFDTLCK